MTRSTRVSIHLAVLLTAFALLAVASTQEASAGLSISIDSGGIVGPAAEVFVTDNGLGDLESDIGFIRVDDSLAMGAFSVVVQTGLSKPIIGPGQIQLGSVTVSSDAGTLTVALSDTDFVTPELSRVDLHVGGTTDGTVSVTGYADDTPTVPAGGPAYGTKYSTGSSGEMTGAFDAALSSGLIDGGLPYSLSLVATITHTEAGQITTFSEITFGQVPEPSSIVLAALCLAALLGCPIRRRR